MIAARTDAGRRARELAKVSATAVTVLARNRLASPGTAFCSWTTVGTRSDRAARTGATLA